MRRRTGGRGGGERGRKAGGVGGTALQAGRTAGDGDWGAEESGVEYTERVPVESGVEGCSCGSSSVANAAGVEGDEEMGERGQKDRPKGERREDLGGEGGWRGDTRERDMSEGEEGVWGRDQGMNMNSSSALQHTSGVNRFPFVIVHPNGVIGFL